MMPYNVIHEVERKQEIHKGAASKGAFNLTKLITDELVLSSIHMYGRNILGYWQEEVDYCIVKQGSEMLALPLPKKNYFDYVMNWTEVVSPGTHYDEKCWW